jgi:general secretion pathway protein E
MNSTVSDEIKVWPESQVFPAIEVLDTLIFSARAKLASDLHLEMTSEGLVAKLRIDGILWLEARVEGSRAAEQLISRVKVLAQLDITEKRIPQDGRLRVSSALGDLDIRVSIMPSVIGEDAVLRLLDKSYLADQHGKLTLESLGFDAQSAEALRSLAKLPYGMLLVTGPTGSGKTTTLYALLSELARQEEKTITIEDPVEYRVPGLLQIPVNEKKGLTFATGLRSILRHDPDRLLVGEIRDRETAEISVQAALTGHQVYTTIHANGVLDVVNRFTHMGCDLHALAGALNGIVAQRLVRALCAYCSRTVEESVTVSMGNRRLPIGCPACRGTGYKGRIAFAEILRVDETLRAMLIERRPSIELRGYLAGTGFESLYDSGLRLVEEGLTTQAELDRVAMRIG